MWYQLQRQLIKTVSTEDNETVCEPVTLVLPLRFQEVCTIVFLEDLEREENKVTAL